MKLPEKSVEIASGLMAAAALIISLYTKAASERAHRDTQTEEAVARTYEAFAEMNALQVEHPELAHLFTNLDDYDETVQLVRAAAGMATTKEQWARHVLAEDAAAYSIFSEVDRLVIARQNAVKIGERERAAFLDQTLDFYSRTLLQNPRLAFFWLEDGAPAYYDPATIEFFAQKVWQAGRASKQLRLDETGPFTMPSDSLNQGETVPSRSNARQKPARSRGLTSR